MLSNFKIVRTKDYLITQNQLKSLQEEIAAATLITRKILQGNSDTIALSVGRASELLKELESLREKLTSIALEEKQRAWSSEGKALFANLLRHHNTEPEKMGTLILAKLIQYLQANQGAIFILNEAQMLEQIACYAYGRNKYTKKTIAQGEGLVGQTFLEKETTLLTEIPTHYINITSGLGGAPPTSLVLVPLVFNEQVLGVLELASFKTFKPFEIDFLEQIGESIASAIHQVRSAQHTKDLLLASQSASEQMRAQEEELRQNLEELQATQEEMERKQVQLDQTSKLNRVILENMPIPTFVKDENGKYTLVNKAQADLLGMTEEAVIGKDDTFFTTSASEREEIRQSDLKALQSVKPFELPLQTFTTKNKVYYFKTTKVSFLNSLTGKRNIIGISVDLSDRVKLEQKLIAEKVVQQNNVLIDLAGRQRMLSQKIGFFCEMVFRGHTQRIAALRHAIDLHDHSLEVIKKGGWPLEIEALAPLDKAHEDLLPAIKEIEEVWYQYKEAAEKIVDLTVKSQKGILYESAIKVIEENGDRLLELNNKLVVNYKKITQRMLMELNVA